MRFTEAVETLQKQNPGTIVFVKNGIFFAALGKDAVALSENMGLKKTCMRERICKVGFSIKASEKYIKTLQEKDLSFAFYVINPNTERPEEIYRHVGKICDETRCSLNCAECPNRRDTEDDILERLRGLGK